MSVQYKTARDLFLAHHWHRYPSFDRSVFEGFVCGRVEAKEGERIELRPFDVAQGARAASCAVFEVGALSWSGEFAAAESVPPVCEVLAVGDWVGIGKKGETVLFTPCQAFSGQMGGEVVRGDALFREKAICWSLFLAQVREFFVERGFLEVSTPSLAPSPGTEPFLDPLSVEIESDGEALRKYLITSPEFHLKQALAAGLPRVFEIAKCFRNREGGPHHRVEFYMLEWYRSFASLREIADDVEALIRHFRPELGLKRVSMSQLFFDLVGFRLESQTTREELLKAVPVRTVADDTFDDVFHRIFIEKIEPRLDEYAEGRPVLVCDYPPSMSALARLNSAGFADRFEVYWRGLELCNAFHELNDPSENRRRFERDNVMKASTGREQVPLDVQLLRSFDNGIPPAGGIALGLERLFMATRSLSSIDQVRPF